MSEKVEFFFDNRSEKRQLIAAWRGYMASRPALQASYGGAPQFEDSGNSPPRQAADLWAWWRRKWHSEGVAQSVQRADPGKWSGLSASHPQLEIALDENAMARKIKKMVSEALEPGRQIYDVRTSFTGPKRAGALTDRR
jgi:hypothetical protein